ncbi:MAG: NIPSNAP family containing protein [Actinomycetes bacterium]
MTNPHVYIHEFIDIIGHNRARYMQHMTANWCPVAREERNQLCFGVWATVGATGRWPEVVNLWEISDWDGLAADFEHELVGSGAQDPALVEWWAAAASLRRGGVDRILVPEPWSPSIEQHTAHGTRGTVYAHEVVTTAPGEVQRYLDALHDEGLAAHAELGLTPIGAFHTAMRARDEAIVIWAIPDWPTWAVLERVWDDDRARWPWRSRGLAFGARTERTLLVDAPLSPLRTGRQPQVEDRRPLDEF